MPRHDLDFPMRTRSLARSKWLNDSQLHLRLPWFTVVMFQNTCHQRGQTMSEVVRALMEQYAAVLKRERR